MKKEFKNKEVWQVYVKEEIKEEIKEEVKNEFPVIYENKKNKELMFGINQKFNNGLTTINNEQELVYLTKTEDYSLGNITKL